MEVFEISDFSLGYDDSLDEAETDPKATQDCLNVDYSQEFGSVRKDFGEKVVSSIGVEYPLYGDLTGFYEGRLWGSQSGAWFKKRCAIAGGNFYQHCPGGFFLPNSEANVFSASEMNDFTHYINYIFITDGGQNRIKKWDGFSHTVNNLEFNNESGVATNNIYKAKHLESFRNRLIVANTTESTDAGATYSDYPSRFRYSEAGYSDRWGSTNYNDIVDREGDEIVRIMTYGDVCVIFKKNSIHSVTWTGGDLVFNYSQIDARSVGNAGWSVATGQGGLYFLCEEGLMVTDGMNVERLPADEKVTRLIKRIYRDYLYKAYAKSDDALHQYYLSVPIDGSDTCNYVIIYDWKYQTWKIKEVDTTCLGLYSEENAGGWRSIASYTPTELAALSWNSSLLYPGSQYIVYGKEDGVVTKRSIGFNNSSAAYNSYHCTPYLDFGKPQTHKEVLMVQPFWKGISGDYAYVKYKTDYDSTWNSCTTAAFTTTGKIEQPFVHLRNTGKRWKFMIGNNNADEYFALYKMLIYYNTRSIR